MLKNSFSYHIRRGVLYLVAASSIVSAAPWKFGVMGDTQWKGNVDGENPNTVPAGIVRQVNQEFIRHGVKMVIQVGDLVDVYSRPAFDTRAELAQELIDAGIGFFPLRGNHEPTSDAANYVSTVFPQACGYMNTFDAVNFQYPSEVLECLSYSFDYNNVRFVMVDQFTRKDNSGSNNNDNLVDQVAWVASVLESRPENTHAFVLSHKNLVGQNHRDVVFGSSPASNIPAQNGFIEAMQRNKVWYYLSGHDHLHHRSVITSPDMTSSVKELICASNSYKFYTPVIPSNDERYNAPTRELPIAQELYTVGYYIFTVDGSNITVDYYSSLNGCGGTWGATVNCGLTVTPSLSFEKRETFGYGLDGKEFNVMPDAPLTVVADTCPLDDSHGTCACIINGINAISSVLYDGRKAIQNISTGWGRAASENGLLTSDILHLWGMENEIGSDECDWYTLSLSFKGTLSGPLAIVSKNHDGNWIRSTDININSDPGKFIIGRFKPEYGPGSRGIDPESKIVWAVINHGGTFALAPSNDGDQDDDGDVDNADIAIVASLKNKPASIKPSADLDNDGKITVLDARKLALIKNR